MGSLPTCIQRLQAHIRCDSALLRDGNYWVSELKLHFLCLLSNLALVFRNKASRRIHVHQDTWGLVSLMHWFFSSLHVYWFSWDHLLVSLATGV